MKFAIESVYLEVTRDDGTRFPWIPIHECIECLLQHLESEFRHFGNIDLMVKGRLKAQVKATARYRSRFITHSLQIVGDFHRHRDKAEVQPVGPGFEQS